MIQFNYSAQSGIVPTETRLFVLEGLGGPQRVRVLDLAGRETATLSVPPVGAVRQLVPLSGRGKDTLLYETTSYIQPFTWSRWTPGPEGTGEAAETALSQKWPLRFDDVEVVREHAVSKDGTRVPMSVLRRQGMALDGLRAVVAHVGIYDMLRFELSPNGAFNVPEFGTVKDPEQFRGPSTPTRPTTASSTAGPTRRSSS